MYIALLHVILPLFVLFYYLQVPYNVAFKNKTSEDVSLLVVDSIVDVIFFIDIGKYISPDSFRHFHLFSISPTSLIYSHIIQPNHI